MQKNDYIEWLKKWFEEKTNYVFSDLNENFFDNGILTSFSTLQLITDIESFFSIFLSDSDLTNQQLYTINGLAEILYKRGSSHVG